MRWTNWAGDQRCAPLRYAEPASEAELVEAVNVAREAGVPLRAVGSGHSFTDAACTDGHMVSLKRMNSVVHADRDSGLAEVQAGIRLRELGPALAERGLAMENLGDVDAQGLAGALVTGTHGTGAAFGNLATQVAALRIVTANGSVVTCSPEDDPDLFRAARVGFGALGVVSTVTLRCRPAHTLKRVDEPLPLAQVLDSIDGFVDSRERFELFGFPYSSVCMTRTTEQVDEPPAPPSRGRELVEDVLVENAALGLAGRAGRLFPRLVPRMNRVFDKLATGSVRLDRSFRIYANPRLVRFTEMEYAIPRENGVEALRAVMDMIERRSLPIGFPIEMRFVAGDDAFLSPAHGRAACYIAVHQYAGMEYESYFRGVEAIMDAFGGRPHWGKRHYQSAETLRPRYPEWDSFAAVRDRLDPDRLFQNDYTRRVLGP